MNFKLISCGFFDSKVTFGGIRETKDRTVQNYEIEYYPVDGGTAFINGKCNSIENGSLLIAKPGDIRHSILPFKAFYVWLDISEPDFIDMVNNFKGFCTTGKQSKKILHCINDIFDESRILKAVNPALEFKIHSLIYEIYMLNNRLSKEKCNHYAYSEAVKKAINFIDNNYCTEISLKVISKYVHLSPIYFHGLFEKEVGLTPRKYVTEKRIEHAEKLLEISDMKLADISAECGFSSQSYFTDIFKKAVGSTPSEYRKNCCEKYAGQLSSGFVFTSHFVKTLKFCISRIFKTVIFPKNVIILYFYVKK